jgi:hypothetical protein
MIQYFEVLAKHIKVAQKLLSWRYLQIYIPNTFPVHFAMKEERSALCSVVRSKNSETLNL